MDHFTDLDILVAIAVDIVNEIMYEAYAMMSAESKKDNLQVQAIWVFMSFNHVKRSSSYLQTHVS